MDVKRRSVLAAGAAGAAGIAGVLGGATRASAATTQAARPQPSKTRRAIRCATSPRR